MLSAQTNYRGYAKRTERTLGDFTFENSGHKPNNGNRGSSFQPLNIVTVKPARNTVSSWD